MSTKAELIQLINFNKSKLKKYSKDMLEKILEWRDRDLEVDNALNWGFQYMPAVAYYQRYMAMKADGLNRDQISIVMKINIDVSLFSGEDLREFLIRYLYDELEDSDDVDEINTYKADIKRLKKSKSKYGDLAFKIAKENQWDLWNFMDEIGNVATIRPSLGRTADIGINAAILIEEGIIKSPNSFADFAT